MFPGLTVLGGNASAFGHVHAYSAPDPLKRNFGPECLQDPPALRQIASGGSPACCSRAPLPPFFLLGQRATSCGPRGLDRATQQPTRSWTTLEKLAQTPKLMPRQVERTHAAIAYLYAGCRIHFITGRQLNEYRLSWSRPRSSHCSAPPTCCPSSVKTKHENCKTSGLSPHVETYFQQFTTLSHAFPRGTLPL